MGVAFFIRGDFEVTFTGLYDNHKIMFNYTINWGIEVESFDYHLVS